MPEKSCCLCLTLRCGTLTIGIVMLVLGSLAVVSAAVFIAFLTGRKGDLNYNRQLDELRLILASQMVSGIITIIFSSLLIHGVRMGRTALVLSWLIYYGILCGLLSVGISTFLIRALSTQHWINIIGLLAGAVASAVFWWWFAVTLKYYAEMRNGETYPRQQSDTIMLS